jgi:hypothetical protein
MRRLKTWILQFEIFASLVSLSQRKMLDLQHQYNNCTTTPHMRVGPTHWDPLLREGLLCSCCIVVVQESNPYLKTAYNSILFREVIHLFKEHSYYIYL